MFRFNSRMMTLFAMVIATAFSEFFSIPAALAGPAPWKQTQKVLASDAADFDDFGYCTAISGNMAITGAPLDDNSKGVDAGAAYVFDITTGQQLIKLLAPDGAGGDLFGVCVSIDGNLALVGAPFDDNSNGVDAGAAYIFDITTGQQLFKFQAPDGQPSDDFGYSVSLSGNLAIIGAPVDDDNGVDSGSAYVFDVTTGLQMSKLLASDGQAGDQFGLMVTLSGNLAGIGAPFDDDNGMDSGSAYVFDLSTGQQIKLLSSDGLAGDDFGFSVGISGNRVVVGADGNDDNGSDSGSVYIFDLSTGQQSILLPSDGQAGEYFGAAVSVSGNRAVIGAVLGFGNSSNSGSAYVFDITTDQQITKFYADDGANNDYFGFFVAISGDMVVSTAILHSEPSTEESGAAYVFQLNPNDNAVRIEDAKTSGSLEFAQFGKSIALSGNVEVVGAIFETGNVTNSGAAFVFDVNTGQQLFKLFADDGVTFAKFGNSLAVSGNLVVIGAPLDTQNGGNSGSAYVFDVTTGQQLFKLIASDGASGDQFGTSVAISGNLAVIGAFEEDNINGVNAGSAYVFDVTTGQQLFKLIASDGGIGDFFGQSVAISGNLVLIGSPDDDDNGTNSGSAYGFDATTGNQLFKLLPSDGNSGGKFGFSVALSENQAFIGATGANGNAPFSGAEYVFDVSTGQQLRKLFASDGQGVGSFGQSISISGNRAVIGANTGSTGSAYVFDFTTGQQLFKLIASDGATGDQFGTSVAINGIIAAVGAPLADCNPSGSNCGSAYLFTDLRGGLSVTPSQPVGGCVCLAGGCSWCQVHIWPADQ